MGSGIHESNWSRFSCRSTIGAKNGSILGSDMAVVAAAVFLVSGYGLTRGTGMDKVFFVVGERSMSCVVPKGSIRGAGRHWIGRINLCPKEKKKKKRCWRFCFSAVLMARILG